MALVYTEVPLYQDFYYRYAINLEGQQRNMNFYWNERDGAWLFDLSNLDGSVIIQGQKIVAQYPLMLNLPITQYGMTGYFILLPNNLATKVDETDSTVIPQFFKFYYVYNEES